jgi:hypothetical protein
VLLWLEGVLVSPQSFNEPGCRLTLSDTGIVGIGGYLTQSGLSFLSIQYGMARDNILEFETVLPNGTIANISAQNNPDLLVAMRGSGDHFVTRYSLLENITLIISRDRYKIHSENIADGQDVGRLPSLSVKGDAINAAFHEFVASNEKDTKAAIIVGFEQAVGGPAGPMLHYFYDGKNTTNGRFWKSDRHSGCD